MKKTIMLGILVLALPLTACSALDVVQEDAARAFGEVLEALPAQAEPETGWYLAAPDGGARFYWSGAGVRMKAAAKPFLDAGLDRSELDNTDGEWLYYSREFAADPETAPGGLPQFTYILQTGRDALGYHTALDHYNIGLGGGNLFEWAKDMKINDYDNSNQDKDIVFVLDPEPLTAAGVDPENVEGWAYAQVPVEENGKMVQVWKFLKPFDLK